LTVIGTLEVTLVAQMFTADWNALRAGLVKPL